MDRAWAPSGARGRGRRAATSPARAMERAPATAERKLTAFRGVSVRPAGSSRRYHACSVRHRTACARPRAIAATGLQPDLVSQASRSPRTSAASGIDTSPAMMLGSEPAPWKAPVPGSFRINVPPRFSRSRVEPFPSSNFSISGTPPEGLSTGERRCPLFQ